MDDNSESAKKRREIEERNKKENLQIAENELMSNTQAQEQPSESDPSNAEPKTKLFADEPTVPTPDNEEEKEEEDKPVAVEIDVKRYRGDELIEHSKWSGGQWTDLLNDGKQVDGPDVEDFCKHNNIPLTKLPETPDNPDQLNQDMNNKLQGVGQSLPTPRPEPGQSSKHKHEQGEEEEQDNTFRPNT